jgi:hypothetical protein
MYTVREPPFNRHIICEEEHINLLKSKAQHRRHTKIKIATWNIQGGLSNTLKCHQVMQEMERLDISICAIQETKGHILGLPSTSKHYGNAFAVKKTCKCIHMNMSMIESQ